MAEALLSNMQICYIHSNIRASASAPVLRCCKVNIMITGYGCILHILITGGVINQGDCKSTEAVLRVYWPQVAKVYLHKKRWGKQVNFCWCCICICIYDVGEEEAGTLIRWWWDYMESKHPSDAANLRPALPARSFVFVFHIFSAVFLYLCAYLISLELHPDLYQIVKVRELHHNCSTSLDLRWKHLKLEPQASLVNNI